VLLMEVVLGVVVVVAVLVLLVNQVLTMSGVEVGVGVYEGRDVKIELFGKEIGLQFGCGEKRGSWLDAAAADLVLVS